MTNGDANSKRKPWVAVVVGVFVSLLILFAAAVWYLRSADFEQHVRQQLVTKLESMTGGRVEIGRFDWNLWHLEFDVRDLTIHGTEPADETPYAHADRLFVNARVVSLLKREIALNLVSVEHPVIHLIVYPDGSTNQPRPKLSSTSRPDIETLFDLAIGRAEVRNGLLLVNDRATPLEFTANDLHASLDHRSAQNRYDGMLSMQLEQARYANLRPTNLNFRLDLGLLQNEFDITALHITSANSSLEANGKLVDFARPAITIEYRGTVDAAELARIGRIPGIKHGNVDINGKLSYAQSVFQASGKLVGRQIDYRTATLHLSNVDAAADYKLDEKTFTLTHLVGRVMGGIARGDLTVKDWSKSLASTQNKDLAAGVLRLTVDNVPARMAAEAFSTSQVRLENLHAGGTGKGTIVGRWRGSRSHAILDLDLSVVPPSRPEADEVPLTGDLKGTYEVASERLHADRLNIALPYLRLTGNGTIGNTTESLQLAVEINDLSRLRPVLAIVNEEKADVLTGQLSFDGEVTGKLLDPTVVGHFQVADFSFPLSAIWTPPPPVQIIETSLPHPSPPRIIHIDSAAGDIAYSAQGLAVRNGLLKRAGAQARLDFSIGLQQGQFTDQSPVGGHLVVENASIADLQQLAGYSYPIDGKLALNLNIVGTRLNPQGGGHFQLRDATVYGETVRSAGADVRFIDQEARIQNLLITHDRAQVKGSGAYHLKTETFHFQVVGSNFELSTIQRLNRDRLSLGGLLNFNASGSGTLDAPVVNASARLQNVVLNGQRLGDASLLAVTKGDVLHLTARSNFLTAEARLDGTVRLHDEIPADLSVHFSNFDLMPFMQSALQTNARGHSFLGGTLLVQGPLKKPDQLAVKAEIPKFSAQMEGVEIHSAEPILATLKNQVIQLESLHLAGTDTQFTAHGSVNLAANGRLDLTANGRLNLKLIQSFDRDLNSDGFVDMNVTASGTYSRPNIVGEVKVTNGALSLIDFPNGLSNINGSLVFNEQRLQVQNLTARTGGGDIRIGGFATYNPRIAFSITAQGEDIRLRYPQGVSSTANLDLKLVGNLNSSVLSGDVTITRFSFNNQFDLAAMIAKTNRPPEAPRNSPLNNVRFNLHVVSTPQLQVQSSLAKVAGNADLQVRGTPGNPVVLGRINLTEGQMEFNGATYRIDRGDVSFLNPAHTEPNLDLAATTRVRDYDITIRVSGLASKPIKPTFSSDPPLPEADIINLLAFGQTREEAEIASTQGSSTMTETVSNTILGQAFNAAVSTRVQKLFGVSRVKISPEVGGAQTNPTAQVTIEQQVSNKITITYITNLTQASQQSIFVEYYLDRNVSLLAGRDQYGVVSFDVRIRQRRR
jgi:translocation and assembly module TamB